MTPPHIIKLKNIGSAGVNARPTNRERRPYHPQTPRGKTPLPGGIYASPTNEGAAYTNPKTLPWGKQAQAATMRPLQTGRGRQVHGQGGRPSQIVHGGNGQFSRQKLHIHARTCPGGAAPGQNRQKTAQIAAAFVRFTPCLLAEMLYNIQHRMNKYSNRARRQTGRPGPHTKTQRKRNGS